MGKVKFALPLFALAFLLAVSVVFADNRKEVLGVSSQGSDLVFPEDVSYGPGFFLPDSPLYTFDLIWQNVRLAISFSPEAKADISSQVAGERLAELRVMIAKNSVSGVTRVLNQMEKDADVASRNLSDAGAAGNNVEEAAKRLNEALKIQRRVLYGLANQGNSDLSLKFQATRKSILKSKLAVEDELPSDLMAKEIKEELEQEAVENLAESERLSDNAQASLDILGEFDAR